MCGSGKIFVGERTEVMKIITLTLNPAFDTHCITEDFRLGHESFFEILSKDAGGKGINISRALNAVNADNTAVVVIGKDNAEEYCKKLNESGVKYLPLFVDGRIRENIILHDRSDVETRVSFNGFTVDKGLFAEAVKTIGEINADTIITLTGSDPKGINIAEVKEFVNQLKAKGAKVVIDNRSFTLSDILEVKPFLIKPNKDEISRYMGREIKTTEEMLTVAKDLYKQGVENVMISSGESGAVLACNEGEFAVVPPKITAVSTIGAGDSMIAGFIYAYIGGKSKCDCLKFAVSFGTSACKQKGTLPPALNDIKNIFKKL